MTQQQDPNTVAMGNQAGDTFGHVAVTTLEGDEYRFPNMNIEILRKVLPEDGRRPATMPCLVMVNISMATITIPMNIIQRISVGEETLWNAERPE